MINSSIHVLHSSCHPVQVAQKNCSVFLCCSFNTKLKFVAMIWCASREGRDINNTKVVSQTLNIQDKMLLLENGLFMLVQFPYKPAVYLALAEACNFSCKPLARIPGILFSIWIEYCKYNYCRKPFFNSIALVAREKYTLFMYLIVPLITSLIIPLRVCVF